MKKPVLWVLIIIVIFIITLIFLKKHKDQKAKISNPNIEINQNLEKTDNVIDEIKFITIDKEDLGFPEIGNLSSEIECYTGFCLSYNEDFEQANWVAYILTKAELNGAFSRTDNFREDPNIDTKSASLNDYRKSGYDRGHLAPAGDMTWSETAMSESFYLSNMSPQPPSFNRGIWKKLEEKVREWAESNDSIYVVSGPLFMDPLGFIGDNNVCIPKYYFKVLLDISYPENKAIAFLLKNEKSDFDIDHFAISVDSLEAFSGYDFFPKLSSTLMESIESGFEFNEWQP